jgi:1-acyl-sn-glycerol-3-phosphate acyltransferase
MRLFGWRFEGAPPDIDKYVLVAAPHTTSWDFLVMLALDFAYKIDSVWLGKESIFRSPLGPFFRKVGGIPVDRSAASSIVDQVVELFLNNPRVVMVIAPEGTRSKSDRWKTGFYHIANGAGVPISLAFMDYGRKVVGFGPVLTPTGDAEADMEAIRDFYALVVPRDPEKFGDVTLTEAEDQEPISGQKARLS